eukprot:CAMPEP_0178624048 /NCGR_PEP_ID=MMETSP0698-20121128/7152_1 /TAXON_ID=265572 /ORGANISM="Extubocellulus spinifer, Strain CCMP396" /LENGTH=537 /DNA_ID=CAMNT_0020263149 /DNA_START=61 /DNA_END=1675 /DNA_ORIENTATION=+
MSPIGPAARRDISSREPPNNRNVRVSSNRNERQRRRTEAAGIISPTGNPINGTTTSAAPVLQRSGSCSKVPYGNLVLEKKSKLETLPLNELMIQLQKPPFVTPPNPYGPTIVDIGLYVYEIAKIDPGENSFVMEGFVDLVWCDPRLRFDVNTTDPFARKQHVYLEKDAEKELEYIWWPTLFFVNEVMPRRIENEELIIYADGTVEYREKFGVELSTNYDMKHFPFDSQTLIVELESFSWPSNVLEFHIEHEDLVGFSDEFDVPEYNVQGIEEHLEERMGPRDRHAFSELVAEIYVTRDPVYYVTKVMVPLGIIVCISWAVFWMDGDDLADRMAISFTGVLTSVAYQFIVAESLPRHIYNTFLDNFVLTSFIMMALTIIENICVSMLLKQEKKDTREMITKMESKIRLMESSRSLVHFENDNQDTGRTTSRVAPAPITNRRIPGNDVAANNHDSDDSLQVEDVVQSQEPYETESADEEKQSAKTVMNKCVDKFYKCIKAPGQDATGKEKAQYLDKTSRYAFPLVYAVAIGILAGVQIG